MRKAWIIGLTGVMLAATPAVADAGADAPAGAGAEAAAGAQAANVRDGVDAWGRNDYHKAIEIWRPAANAGDADAQFNLAQAYTLGRGVPLDMPMAESWFRKAALQGHIAAQAKYGLVLFDQGKRSEAVPWLDKAAGHGEPRAQLVLGTMLFNGDGVAKDWPRAYGLMVRAAAAGTPHSSEVQAQMDKLIPVEQRQQGLVLARQYEAEAQRSQLPPELAGTGGAPTIRGTDLPPSNYDPRVGGGGGKPQIVALQPPQMATPSAPPPARSGARPRVVAPAPAPAPVVVLKPRREAPPPAIVARGGWRVQLGAFGDAGNARKLWAKVGKRFVGADVRYVKNGALTRVLVGPYGSHGAALAACGSVRPCVPLAE